MALRRYRPYIAFFVFVLTGTLALASFLLGTSYYELQRKAETDAQNVVGVLEARLEAALRRVEANLNELAAEVPLAALDPEAAPAYRQTLHQQLSLGTRQFPEIAGLRLIDLQGNVLYASDMTAPQASAVGRSYFDTLHQHPELPLYFSEVSVGRMTNRPLLFVAVPIRDAQGAFRGIAMAPLELAYIQKLFDAVNLGTNGVITFRRSDDGRLVLRRPERPGTVNQALSNNPMHLRVEAGEREGLIRFHAAIDKMERVYAFKRIGDYPFYVAAGIAADDFLANWWVTAAITAVAGSTFLIGLALLLWRLQSSEAQGAMAEGKLQASEERLQLLLNSAGEGICGLDRDGRTTFLNPAAARLLGFEQGADWQGKGERDFLAAIHTHTAAGEPLPPEDCAIRQALHAGQPVHGDEDVFTRADGERFPVQYDAYPLRKQDEVIGAVLLFSDITERKRNAAQIEFLAHHDFLTALPNRFQAEARFRQAAAEASRQGTEVAMLFLDLDAFKTINDSLGHDIGDKLLQAVAERLRAQLRDTDTVCRFGGDEFMIIVPGLPEVDALLPVLDKLLASLEQTFPIESYQLSTSVSIGAAIYPHDGRDFTALMQKADTAMYHAKDAGRNTYRLFDGAMNLHAQEALRLRGNFQQALERGEFVLYMQPQIDLQSGRVVGAEALVRWDDPLRGLIPPGQFIPVAESSGFIVPLGQWVLREACRQAVAWAESQGQPLGVAVNISAIQFKRGDLVRTVTEALESSGLPPHRLELELTETTLLNQTENVLKTLQHLRELGVRLSIDDFGTGYSSLAYLKRLAVNKLKIDQSFVRNLADDAEDAAIVRAIIEMAHSLNLLTVAEGVENEAALASLRQFHCDEAQGYFFARPLPEGEFRDYLSRQA
jgi:diguanylate cyclase (GGDEF)-like protein/PAS domain S-box-containing protein